MKRAVVRSNGNQDSAPDLTQDHGCFNIMGIEGVLDGDFPGMVCLDEMLSEGKISPPDYIKVDVEGAEYLALSGAVKLLAEYHPILFLDTHNREAHQATIRLLKDFGYHFEVLDGKPIAETKELIARFS